MGVDVADYDGDGLLDIVKTNFSQDYTSLYRNQGNGLFVDASFRSGLGAVGPSLGWGVGFVDADNDGLLDLFIANGHIYPEIARTGTSTYRPAQPGVQAPAARPLQAGNRGSRAAAAGEVEPWRRVRRLRQRRRHRRDRLCSTIVRCCCATIRPAALDHDAAGRHDEQPVGNRREGDARGRRPEAGSGGPERRQLRVPQRHARSFRPGGGADRGHRHHPVADRRWEKWLAGCRQSGPWPPTSSTSPGRAGPSSRAVRRLHTPARPGCCLSGAIWW